MYGASKAALKPLTERLHAELRGTPVRVTVGFRGAVATGITGNSGVHAAAVARANDNAANQKVLPPKEAADVIIRGMEQGAYRALVGARRAGHGLVDAAPARARHDDDR